MTLALPSIVDIRASLARDRYRNDPVGWVEERLKETVWSKQREIMESVRDHRRTAVATCHNTGKSWVAGRIAAWWIDTSPIGESFVVTSAPSGPQVKAILWKEIGRAHARGQLVGRTNQTEWWATPPSGKEEMVAYGRKPSDFAPDAFQGIHAPRVLVIFDEACGMPVTLWNAGDTLLSNEESRKLAIGNPDDPNSEFAEVCKPGSGWNVIHIGYDETPNFTGEVIPESLSRQLIGPTWVEEKRKKWGESNPLYVAKVLGRFPVATTDGLIPMKWVRDAQNRDLPPGQPIELGVDVGGGGDKNVIALRRGPYVRVIRRDQAPNTMETLGNVMASIKETGAAVAKVDMIGIGRGAVDRAKEIADDVRKTSGERTRAKKVLGVQVSEAPRDKEAYANLRAEGYWGLRERFQDGDIDIDPGDDDLAAQLVGLRFKRTSRGRIQIESKEEIKRAGRPSPDEADALMLAFLVGKKKARATWGR